MGSCAFVVNFLGTVAMWWLYFHIGQTRAAHVIEHSDDPGRIGADRLHLRAHPDHRRHRRQRGGGRADARAPVGARDARPRRPRSSAGVALFLAGNVWFKGLTARWAPLSHLVGLGLFAAAARSTRGCRRSASARWRSLILVVVAVWEYVSLGGGLREVA